MIGKTVALLAVVAAIVALACSGQEELQCEETFDLEEADVTADIHYMRQVLQTAMKEVADAEAEIVEVQKRQGNYTEQLDAKERFPVTSACTLLDLKRLSDAREQLAKAERKLKETSDLVKARHNKGNVDLNVGSLQELIQPAIAVAAGVGGTVAAASGSRLVGVTAAVVLAGIALVPAAAASQEEAPAKETIVCGDHEGCEKSQHIISEQARQLEDQARQLEDQAQQLKDQEAFVTRLHSRLGDVSSSTAVTSYDPDDPGKAARCSNVRPGTAMAGDLECNPDQVRCQLADGYMAPGLGDQLEYTGQCAAYWTGRNFFETDAGTGGHGGSCTCPDGQVYQVGDNGDSCGSLACIGGTSGQCNQAAGAWSGNKVTCNVGDAQWKYHITSHRNQQLQDDAGTVGLSSDTGNSQEWRIWRKEDKYLITSHRAMQLEDRDGTVGLDFGDGPWQEWSISSAGDGNIFETDAGTGGHGGSCTCPDGQVYQVGDNGDSCGSLACIGGTSGQCNQHAGEWSGNKVSCDAAHDKYLITSHRNQQLEDHDGTVGLSSDTGGYQQWSISSVLSEAPSVDEITVTGAVVGCPDGGIGWEGVYMAGICASWDSLTARLTQQICNDDKTVCTKMTTKHLHEMSKSAGVLMMKRVNCDADTGQCSVFKAGKCFDVGQDVFSSIYNENNIDNIGAETHEWASLITAQLKAGSATTCSTTSNDHKIAEAGIKGY